MGVVFIGVGGFKIWSAYNFAKTAKVVQGTFSGYETVLVDSATRTSDTPGSEIGSEVTYPMFSYTDKNGHLRLESDPESHFIKRFKHGEKVTVLVSPDGSAPPRLGDIFSLFGPGISLCLFGITFILLMSLCIKLANTYFSLDPTVYEGQSSFRWALSEFGQSRFPVGGLVFLLGGFLLIAGVFVGTGTYFILKRADQALINALHNDDFKTARILAYKGRGIDGKNQDGDNALIVALKANQPEVARAILDNFFVSGTALSPDGSSPVHLAAVNGDHQTLAILLQKGAEAFFDIKHSVVYHLIDKNDIATLKVIFDNGYNLDWKYGPLPLGDHAVMLGNTEIVKLIQAYNGVFKSATCFYCPGLKRFRSIE